MDFRNLFFSSKGRISRKTYWLSYLALIGVFGVAIAALAYCPSRTSWVKIVNGGLMVVLAAFYIWAAIAIQIKRWHDRDKSGWFALVGLIPYVGGLWVFIECGCLPGTTGPNRFGDQP